MAAAGYIILTLKFTRVNKRWTADCEELGTAASGRSIPEADRKLKDAVLSHLNTFKGAGERERFLKEHGIQSYQAKPGKEITVCLPVATAADVFIEPYVQRLPALAKS